MEPSELALYTNQELIEELLRRTTFLGVVVHSSEELKSAEWGNSRMFKVRFNANLNQAEAGRLLDTVAGQLDIHGSDSLP